MVLFKKNCHENYAKILFFGESVLPSVCAFINLWNLSNFLFLSCSSKYVENLQFYSFLSLRKIVLKWINNFFCDETIELWTQKLEPTKVVFFSFRNDCWRRKFVFRIGSSHSERPTRYIRIEWSSVSLLPWYECLWGKWKGWCKIFEVFLEIGRLTDFLKIFSFENSQRKIFSHQIIKTQSLTKPLIVFQAERIPVLENGNTEFTVRLEKEFWSQK